MLQFELNAGGQEGGAFEQARDHRIGAFADKPAESLGDAGILLRELPRLLVEQRQFAVIEVEKFPVHLAKAG